MGGSLGFMFFMFMNIFLNLHLFPVFDYRFAKSHGSWSNIDDAVTICICPNSVQYFF